MMDQTQDAEMAKNTPLGNNLLQLLREHGVSQNRLAEATGVAQSTISRIINSQNVETTTDTLLKIANFFGITVERLRGQSTPAYQSVANTIVSSGSGVAIYPLQLSLTEDGAASIKLNKLAPSVDYPQIKGIDPVGRSWTYIFAPDDSMMPLIKEGDLLIIDMAHKTINEGRIYAVAQGAEAIIRSAHQLPDGSIRLRARDSERYPDIDIPKDGHSRILIIGRVLIQTRPL